MAEKRHPPSRAHLRGRYIPEWGDFQAVADRLNQNRLGSPIRVGELVRGVLRAFLALKPEGQDKVLKSAFLGRKETA